VAFYGAFVGYYGANCFQQYVDMGWTKWPNPKDRDESQLDKPARTNAIRYLREHERTLPRVMVFRVGRAWDLYKPFSMHGDGSQNVVLNYRIEGRGRIASWMGMLAYFALLPFALGGLWLLWRRRVPLSPLLSWVLAVSITAATTFGVTRYRVPADVVIVVLAAVALDALLPRREERATDV
jgi:hypothetical protein